VHGYLVLLHKLAKTRSGAAAEVVKMGVALLEQWVEQISPHCYALRWPLELVKTELAAQEQGKNGLQQQGKNGLQQQGNGLLHQGENGMLRGDGDKTDEAATHDAAISFEEQPNLADGGRVETKIFVSVFSRKFREKLFSLFAKKLTKSYENNESFRENFHGNENFVKKWRGKQKCRETSEFQEANEV
jgi:hypothetical protein